MKYTLIYLRKKIDPFERSTLQIMSIIARSEEKEKIKSFSYNSKKIKGLLPFMLKTFIS